MRVLRPRPGRWRRIRTPGFQFAAAVGIMIGGAALVAWWMVGVVLMIGGLLWSIDALLRDAAPSGDRRGSHADVLERWRQAR